MPDIQQRIADIIEKHLVCECGDWAENLSENVAHAAEVLVSELGLKPTYVTGWMGSMGMVRVTPPMHGEAWPDEPAKRYVRWGTTKWELAE